MKEVKHTPGPWKIDGNYVWGATKPNANAQAYICDIKFPIDDPEIAANARLIAAAPDLLAAAKNAVDGLLKCQGATEQERSYIADIATEMSKAVRKAVESSGAGARNGVSNAD